MPPLWRQLRNMHRTPRLRLVRPRKPLHVGQRNGAEWDDVHGGLVVWLGDVRRVIPLLADDNCQ